MPATRRQAIAAFAGLSGAAALTARHTLAVAQQVGHGTGHGGADGGNTVVGTVDHDANGFTPTELLTVMFWALSMSLTRSRTTSPARSPQP